MKATLMWTINDFPVYGMNHVEIGGGVIVTNEKVENKERGQRTKREKG